MTTDNPITDLLAAPLSPDWTVEGLAEQVLSAIAAQRSEEVQELVLDVEAATDRQSRRVLRPLLACLATKSAAEAGTSANLYGGSLSFKRPGPEGPVWILGQFENSPGAARVAFRRSSSPPETSEPRAGQPPDLTGASSRPDAPQPRELLDEEGKHGGAAAAEQEEGLGQKPAITLKQAVFEIVINRSFDTFDDEDREYLFESIKRILDLAGEAKITRRRA